MELIVSRRLHRVISAVATNQDMPLHHVVLRARFCIAEESFMVEPANPRQHAIAQDLAILPEPKVVPPKPFEKPSIMVDQEVTIYLPDAQIGDTVVASASWIPKHMSAFQFREAIALYCLNVLGEGK